MQVRFWPPEPDEGGEPDVPADAVDAHEKIAFVGGAFDGGPNDCAVFQNQADRKQFVVFLNQERNGVKLLTITDKLAVVDFGNQKVKLNRTKAQASLVKRTTRRGSSSRRSGRSPRTSSSSRTSRSSSSRSTTSSSVRTYGGGATSRSSSGRTSSGRTLTSRPTASSSYRPRTSTTSSAAQKGNGRTTPTSASRPTSSAGGASRTKAGVNWRQYWNDRMKKRNQQK